MFYSFSQLSQKIFYHFYGKQNQKFHHLKHVNFSPLTKMGFSLEWWKSDSFFASMIKVSLCWAFHEKFSLYAHIINETYNNSKFSSKTSRKSQNMLKLQKFCLNFLTQLARIKCFTFMQEWNCFPKSYRKLYSIKFHFCLNFEAIPFNVIPVMFYGNMMKGPRYIPWTRHQLWLENQ